MKNAVFCLLFSRLDRNLMANILELMTRVLDSIIIFSNASLLFFQFRIFTLIMKVLNCYGIIH